MQTYIYIDESGCLGFNFEKLGTSKYFTIALVIFKEKKQKNIIEYAIKKTLKRKLNHTKKKRLKREIKGTATHLSIKEYLFQQIKNRSGDFEIYAITFNKKNVHPSLQHDKHRLYNWVIKTLLDQINKKSLGTQIMIVLDKCKNQKQIKDCNQYLLGQLKASLDLDISINIDHRESHVDIPLQIADIVANALQRKSEFSDDDVFKLISSFIKYYGLYFNK